MDHRNIDLVRAYLATAGSGDLDRAAQFFTDDFVWVAQGDNPGAGIRTGPRAVLNYFGEMKGLSDGTYAITGEVDWLVSDSRVMLIAAETMTVGGRRHDWRRFILFTVRGAQFCDLRIFEDDQAAFDTVFARTDARPPA
jgi:ketosteroid isomerase-like protein